MPSVVESPSVAESAGAAPDESASPSTSDTAASDANLAPAAPGEGGSAVTVVTEARARLEQFEGDLLVMV